MIIEARGYRKFVKVCKGSMNTTARSFRMDMPKKM